MTGPYALAAAAYLESGWSPVPFPAKSKFPPADGYTGAHGKDVDEVTVKRWTSGRAKAVAGKLNWVAANGNIGLRLPPTVIGIDVDMYEGKAGRETFEKAIAAWGPLPPTWYPSSRTDGSGIRLFRIPEGLAWPGKLPQGGGVEIIRWDHRYIIVGPSIHDKTGLPYLWWVEDVSLTAVTEDVGSDWGLVSPEEFPDADAVPELPEAWVAGLTSGKRWEERAAADLDPDDVRLWLSDRNGPELCATMRATVRKYERQIRQASDDGGTHDEGRNGAWAVIGDAHAGHSGVSSALAKLRKVFLPATSRRSSERLSSEEWTRIVVRGVQKVVAEGEPDSVDICGLLSDGVDSSPGTGEGGDRAPGSSSGSAHLTFARTDAGNAERLALAHRDEQKFVDGVGWFIWRPEEQRWSADRDGTVNRRAIAVARAISEEAEFLAEEDPKEYAELRKFARASENLGKLRAMVDVCADLSGMTLPLTAFDADPARLGRVLLKPNPGVEVTPALPEHRVTMRLGCDFVAGAKSREWTRFLNKMQPDPDVRYWLQRLVGYSLYGSNRDRLFIANLGVSSTGKTTFMESLRAALGEYASIVNMTIYRDNQDDKPRPDILRVLRKRLVLSEETSSAWHLHADQVKRITGGAPMSARAMRSNEFAELVPAFTPWIFVNTPPTIESADEAVLRRLVVVPWDVVMPKAKEDSSLRDRLMTGENRAAVLAWALEGWTEYAANPDLSAPLGALTAREEFLSELSDFDRALWDIAVIEEGAWCVPNLLYQAYRHWATAKGVRIESETKFGTFLSGRGYGKVQKRVDGKPVRVRSGVRISDEYKRIFSGS